MRILAWHVHGGWMDAFVRGDHDYLLPTTPDRGAWGLGRANRPWSDRVVEIAPENVAAADIDVVVLQRLEEIEEAERLLGAPLGAGIPAVYVEHNTPRRDVPNSRHPLADRSDLMIVHVTHFNRLMWDCGSTRTTVIEHGVPDPGALYTGEAPRLGVVINEPVRRGRVTGTDLLPAFAHAAPLDVFGMGTTGLPEYLGLSSEQMTIRGDLPSAQLHSALARCRVYLHPLRWTSLGLALLEAMHLGMPVVALATTEAYRAVPPEAGILSTDVGELVRGARRLVADPEEAARRGVAARHFALEWFGLPAFLDRWTTVLDDAVVRTRRSSRGSSSSPSSSPSANPSERNQE